MKLLIGSRTIMGMPTEMIASSLCDQLREPVDDDTSSAVDVLWGDAFLYSESMLNRDIIQRELAFMPWRPVENSQ